MTTRSQDCTAIHSIPLVLRLRDARHELAAHYPWMVHLSYTHCTDALCA